MANQYTGKYLASRKIEELDISLEELRRALLSVERKFIEAFGEDRIFPELEQMKSLRSAASAKVDNLRISYKKWKAQPVEERATR